MGLLASARFALRATALRRPPRLAADRLAALREGRLRSLLRHAAEHSPFYRARFRGLDVGRCPLAELPPTTKPEIMASYDGVVTDRAVRRVDVERFLDDPANWGRPYLGRYAASHTSGSQGQPLIIVQDRDDLGLLYALHAARGTNDTASPLEAVRRLRRPTRLAAVLMKDGSYPSVSAFDHMPAGVRPFVTVLRLAPTDPDIVERLNEFRPHTLTAYAAVLEQLAVNGGLRLAPDLKRVVNNSEVLTDRARGRMEAAFGVRVLDNYATGECLFLSNGCPAGPGSHVNADWAILEVVDADGRPVPAWRPGHKVLVTNLANRVQPFIRYEVGDRVTMADGPCPCGSRLPKVARVDGRSAECLTVWDGRRERPVLGEVFKHALDHAREVREWQAVQEGANRVRLRLEPLPGERVDRERARRMLDRQLEQFGLAGLLDVELEEVERLPPDPKTGKFRRIVPRG